MKVGEEEISRHTVESHVQVEKERTGSGDSNAKKEGMKKNDKKGEDDTGWRRLIGSPQFQIFFHQKATNLKYKSLLWKITCKDKGCYESWPPCERERDPQELFMRYLCESGGRGREGKNKKNWKSGKRGE